MKNELFPGEDTDGEESVYTEGLVWSYGRAWKKTQQKKMCPQCSRFGVREQGLAKQVRPEYRGIVGQTSASKMNSIGDESLWKC